MIKLNDRFEFERTKYNWELHEWSDGKTRDGKPKRKKRTTYYPNLKQVCGEVLDRSAGDCESLEEIIELLSSVTKVFEDNVGADK